jgi:23S rRNA pseudouridine1911/1915/1917 synthase
VNLKTCRAPALDLKGKSGLVPQTFTTKVESPGQTLAALLRDRLPGQSWTAVRNLVAGRRVRIDGYLCLDPARRLRAAQTVELLAQPIRQARPQDALVMRHLDDQLVVVEKPPGLSTVRHPAERAWTARRKALHPTLEDLLPPLIAAREGKRRKGPLPRLRVVHRLDKETSGLVVFARTVPAERGLGKQFLAHTVLRRYLAVVRGVIQSQRIESRLIRDRGDGRRGSSTDPSAGKAAVTHVDVLEHLRGYTLLGCRLETGRTHQIRIHLAELGHPVCGEKVYNQRPDGAVVRDTSAAPRLALHAAELGFVHPATGEALRWEMALPEDLRDWLDRLRTRK